MEKRTRKRRKPARSPTSSHVVLEIWHWKLCLPREIKSPNWEKRKGNKLLRKLRRLLPKRKLRTRYLLIVYISKNGVWLEPFWIEHLERCQLNAKLSPLLMHRLVANLVFRRGTFFLFELDPTFLKAGVFLAFWITDYAILGEEGRSTQRYAAEGAETRESIATSSWRQTITSDNKFWIMFCLQSARSAIYSLKYLPVNTEGNQLALICTL